MMTFQQFRIILDKIKTERNEIRYYTDCGQVSKVQVEFNHGVIEVSHQYRSLHFEFKHGKSISIARLDFCGWSKWFSPSYWLWRHFCISAERKIKAEEKKDRQIAINRQRQEIDEAIIKTFPNILEDQLLGDKDDW